MNLSTSSVADLIPGDPRNRRRSSATTVDDSDVQKGAPLSGAGPAGNRANAAQVGLPCHAWFNFSMEWRRQSAQHGMPASSRACCGLSRSWRGGPMVGRGCASASGTGDPKGLSRYWEAKCEAR